MVKQSKEHPERPLECSDCRKPIAVHYTEIVKGEIKRTAMCKDCPQLQRHLKGIPHEEAVGITAGAKTGLACGECGTSLEDVRVGHPLGCSVCYEVFGDVLLSEMLTSHRVSSAMKQKKKAVPLHIGRSPGEVQEISTSLRLLALNEALDETLKREDYEQAAWLRDQIKALTEDVGEDSSDKK